METIEIKLKKDEYPMLDKIKKKELNIFIQKIFKTGYDMYFPNTDIKDNNINTFQINDKLESLENSLIKLIGLSSNSNKKGNFAENVLEEIFMTRYGDIKFERKSQTAHVGDAWLYLPNNSIIMLEVKNYTTTVNKDEIIKLQNDMITNNIRWGIMASFNSQIQGMREMDYHTFTHHNNIYSVVMIANLGQDIVRMDLALQMIRKLMSSDNKIQLVVDDINTSLLELDQIVQKNYALRDFFYTMENDIIKSLSTYHVKLRDYQYEIEIKIKEINKKISNSISIEKPFIEKSEILSLYQGNKVLPILVRIIDVIKEKDWNIEYKDNTFWNVLSKDIIMFTVSIQSKKVIVNINDMSLNFNINKNHNSNILILKELK